MCGRTGDNDGWLETKMEDISEEKLKLHDWEGEVGVVGLE